MKRAYIEISNACNLACSFCPSPTITGKRQWMSMELFEATLQQLEGLVEEVYLHVLGEPLLHPLLESFITACEQHKLKVNLTTNGLLIDQYAAFLLNSPVVRQINFSIHSLFEIAKPQADQALDSILRFSKQCLKLRPDLYINLRLWNEDAERAPALHAWNLEMWQRISQTLGDASSTPPPFDPRKKRNKIAGRISINMDSLFEWPADTNADDSRERGTCQALKTHCAILADGRVVACCLDYQGDLELGHVLNGGIAEALNSERARTMRHGFNQRQLVEPFCKSCTFCQRFSTRPTRKR
jgi:radical SAM protein with 4Fe4S-binding SPASM domain